MELTENDHFYLLAANGNGKWKFVVLSRQTIALIVYPIPFHTLQLLYFPVRVLHSLICPRCSLIHFLVII
jgi:hypothetical protein